MFSFAIITSCIPWPFGHRTAASESVFAMIVHLQRSVEVCVFGTEASDLPDRTGEARAPLAAVS